MARHLDQSKLREQNRHLLFSVMTDDFVTGYLISYKKNQNKKVLFFKKSKDKNLPTKPSNMNLKIFSNLTVTGGKILTN